MANKVTTVKPLITDPPKSGQPLQRTAHLPPIDFTIELILYEPPRSGHLTTDTDQALRYLAQYKITSENGQ